MASAEIYDEIILKIKFLGAKITGRDFSYLLLNIMWWRLRKIGRQNEFRTLGLQKPLALAPLARWRNVDAMPLSMRHWFARSWCSKIS